jgi:hypothetical protein
MFNSHSYAHTNNHNHITPTTSNTLSTTGQLLAQTSCVPYAVRLTCVTQELLNTATMRHSRISLTSVQELLSDGVIGSVSVPHLCINMATTILRTLAQQPSCFVHTSAVDICVQLLGLSHVPNRFVTCRSCQAQAVGCNTPSPTSHHQYPSARSNLTVLGLQYHVTRYTIPTVPVNRQIDATGPPWAFHGRG